jgi:transposase-like protein
MELIALAVIGFIVWKLFFSKKKKAAVAAGGGGLQCRQCGSTRISEYDPPRPAPHYNYKCKDCHNDWR